MNDLKNHINHQRRERPVSEPASAIPTQMLAQSKGGLVAQAKQDTGAQTSLRFKASSLAEWTALAKTVLKRTKHDPYNRQEQMITLKESYAEFNKQHALKASSELK